jgi:broad specificity phosphatase PhoE
VILVRHAESAWNVQFGRSRIDAGLPDPDLTAAGIGQVESAAARLRAMGVDRLLTSPYRRALRTASQLADLLAVPIVGVEPLVRERCAFSCDQGTPPEQLQRDWPRLDFSMLGPVWWGGLIESDRSLMARCAAFRARMGRIGATDGLAIVSHWGFIRALTGHELANLGCVEHG